MKAKGRVLVVDDEKVVRTSFDRVLTESGYRVNTAPDWFEAMERIQTEDYDVAFVDLKMPGVGGMEVARDIRRVQPQVQVIIVTGYGTPENEAEAWSLGVTGFAAKPLSPEAISGLAERALERRKRFVPPPEPAAEVKAAPAAAPAAEEEPAPSVGKALAQLAGGSLLGLAYVIFLPVIGMVLLARVVGEKVMASGTKVK